MKTRLLANVRAQALSEVPFEFVNARLRGRRGLLYEGARLRELAGLPSVEELAWRLYPRQDIPDRFALERRMLAACVQELASFVAYLSGPYRALYRSLLDRYAVENLKVLLRLFLRKGEDAEGIGYLIELPRELSLPDVELLSSSDIDEFLGRIPLPAVRACAQGALPLYHETGRRAFLEMAFDMGYWSGVPEALDRLSHPEQVQCSAPIRCEFDAMRLLATLRAARLYRVPWRQLRSLLPEGRGAIGIRTLGEVYENPEPQFVMDRVPQLRRLSVSLEQAGEIGALEDVLWHEAVRLANRQYYGVTSGPAVLVSYFYLKREELRHLLALTQMLRRRRPEAEILEHLGL